MNGVSKIAAFISANLIGFFSAALCYAVGLQTGAINPADPAFDAQAFQTVFMGGTMMTWAACAVLSTAYLFMDGKMRFVFLLAPAIVPLTYGLSVVFGSLSSL